MRSDELLDELRRMFHHRPNKIALRHRFEERTWKKNETSHDYVHEKRINLKANHIAMGYDEILGYIIDGIPDQSLHDLARVRGFMTKDEILQAFSEISLRDRSCTAATTSSRFDEKRGGARRKNDGCIKDDTNASEKRDRGTIIKRCFNCGRKDHVSQNCPTKDQGHKCFECNKYGHIGRNCPTKTNATATNSCAID